LQPGVEIESALFSLPLSLLHRICNRPKRWSPLPPLVGGRGISFLRVVRVRACLRWCIVVVVGATFGQIKLSQLQSHAGSDLHGGVSGLMATCAGRSFRSVAWSSRSSSDLARSASQWPSLVAGVRWFLWSKDVGLEMVDLLFFSDFVDGRRRILVQDSTGTSPDRRATTTCALLRAATCSSTHKVSLAMVLSWI
jgi:hypothetical protein